MPTLEDITNFIQLTPEVGTAGQPAREQFVDIAAAGFSTVVNLAMPDSDNALPDEGGLVTAAGMRYVHLPVDFAAPTAADARTFIGIMRVLEGERVFVHCALNLRVSAFMYLYLTHVKGCSEADARSPILDRWAPRMDDAWRSFLALEKAEVVR